MEVITILVVLTIIGLIIYSIFAVNAYCIVKYNYKPLQIKNLIIIAVPCFISIILFWHLEPENGGYVNYKDLNHIVLYLLVLGSSIFVSTLIFKHTKNILIALYSTLLLLIGSIIIAFILIGLIITAISGGKKKKQ
jgi:hypothetical protein